MCVHHIKRYCKYSRKVFSLVALILACTMLFGGVLCVRFIHTKKIEKQQHFYLPEETLFCASDVKHPFCIVIGADKYVVLSVQDIAKSRIKGYLVRCRGEERSVIAESENSNVLIDIEQLYLENGACSLMTMRLRDTNRANELRKCRIRLKDGLSGKLVCEIMLLHYKKDRDFLRKGILKEILTEKENEQAMGARE